LKAENREETIVAVENAYTKFYPDNLFEYYFIEDSYMRQYQDDNRFSKVIGIFTFLAIVISCLGLIGLSSYTASLRTKEIGIRKVLGASVRHVVLLLSGNFIRLVLISIVLSIPIAYMAMQYWLSAYAYRITPTPAMFLLPVLLVFIIAALTVSVQVMKAALADPAKTLKCE
jgi:putative ABC transport system permease protein